MLSQQTFFFHIYYFISSVFGMHTTFYFLKNSAPFKHTWELNGYQEVHFKF